MKQATRVFQRNHTNSMTKHIPVRKNTTRNHEQDAEGESSASEGQRETVGKPTGKTPDMQNVWDITDVVIITKQPKQSSQIFYKLKN